MSLITTPLIILLLFFITISTVFIVKQQSAAIIERFGKFQSVRKPGFQVKIPLVDRIAGRLSLKVLQLDVVVETKTSDDVFVKLKVSVQYRVVESKVFHAFYKLDFPQDQITSYVFDLIRSQVPKMKLDDVFSKQDDIAVAVKQSLGDAMEEYGCDKPDLRIPLKLIEISDLVKDEEFKVFAEPAKDQNSRVVAMRVSNGNSLSRGQIDDYTKFVSKL